MIVVNVSQIYIFTKWNNMAINTDTKVETCALATDNFV